MRKTAIVLALLVVAGIVAAMLPAQESSRRTVRSDSSINADPNATAGEALADRLESIDEKNQAGETLSDDEPVQPRQSEFAAPRELNAANSNSANDSSFQQPPRELSVLGGADKSATSATRQPDSGDEVIGSSVLQRPTNGSIESTQPALREKTARGTGSIGDDVQNAAPVEDVTSQTQSASSGGQGQISSRRRQQQQQQQQQQQSTPRRFNGSSRRSVPPSIRPRQIVGRSRGSQRAQLIQSWGPSLRVETTGPREIVVGKEASYVVNVINSGRVDANEVYLRVSLPTWVQPAGNSATTGSAEIKDDADGVSRLVWSIPSVKAGRDEQLKLRFVARENRPVKLSVDWVFKPIVSSAEIKVQQPQLRLNLTGPSDILLGTSETFTLVVSNPGSGPAENVVLSIATVGDAKTSRTLGTIAAGGRRKLEFDLTANDPGRMAVRAEVVGDGGLKDKLVENIEVRSPKLNIRIGGPRLKFAGTKATYEVRIANKGNATADKVVAQVKLPSGAKYVGGLNDPQVVAGGIRWPVGRLETGAERVFRINCQLMLAGENRFDVAAVAGSQNRARGSFVTKVEALADLKLEVNDPQGPQTVGKDVEYELVLTNRGTKAAENIDITVQFSKGIEPIRATGAEADVIPGQVLFKRLPKLAPGRKIKLKIVARASKKGNHRFRAQVECKDPETRLASEDTTRFFGDDGALQATRTGESSKR